MREPFNDPYVARVWTPGEQVEETDLLRAGWKQSDVDRAVGSLLVPMLVPAPLKKEKVKDGGETAEEVTDG